MKKSHICFNFFRFHYRSSPLCVSILSKNFSPRIRLHSLFCSPAMNKDVSKNINSVVGLQIGLSHVSWARIETKTNFLSHLDFLSLPADMNKMELHQVYLVADKIINSLPPADCYAMESLSKIVSSSSGKLQLTLQATRMQLVSMMVALLNSNSNSSDESSGVVNKVMFMKPRMTARLFNLLVGSETISSHEAVRKFLTKSDFTPFTPINCCPDVLTYYNQPQNINKEILGQAFLMTVTFTELMYHKNPECYKLLLGNSRKKPIV